MSMRTGARRWAERYKENKCTVIRESSCFDRGSCFCMRRVLSIPAAFQLLDTIPEKKRGMGAVVCLCPEPGVLRDNVLALPVWYI